VEIRPPYILVAENLDRITASRGITLADVAKRAGIDQSELFNVITGQYDADVEWLGKIARALDVRMAQLVIDREREPIDGR